MRIASRHWRGFGLCLLLLTPSAWAQEEAPTLTIQTVALSSDPAPGTGGTFGGFFVPIIDSQGTIVFSNEDGIWTHRNGVPAQLVVVGQTTPVSNLDQPAEFFFLSTPNVNQSGDVAFGDGVSAGTRRLWRAAASSSIVTLVARNEFGFDPDPDNIKLDSDGRVVFNFASNSGFPSIRRAVAAESVEVIATRNDSVPGLMGNITFGPFSDFVVSPDGVVAFQATLLDALPGTGQAIFKYVGGSLQTVVRTGALLPGDTSGRTFDSLVNTISTLEAPAIRAGGEVTFRANTPNGSNDPTPMSIWSGTGPDDLKLVIKAGEATPTVSGNDVTLTNLGAPVVNSRGTVAFFGGEPGKASIWTKGTGELKRIVSTGDSAGGTNANFFSFEDVSVTINRGSGDGQVAFMGLLDTSSAGVDAANDRGLWGQDAMGDPVLIAREGTLLETAAGSTGTISQLMFAGGSGNDDGRPSGFSDNGDLAFMASFTDGTSGIFRATFSGPPPQPAGEGFVWSGEAGDDNWHTKNGTETNWNDSDDMTVDPPGAAGDETVTIQNNVPPGGVVLDQQDVNIGKLTAFGKLIVRKSLTLNQESIVESLVLDSLESEIVANAELTLTGDDTLFQAGTITINSDDGVVNEGTVTVEPFTVAIEAGLAVTHQAQQQAAPAVTFAGKGPFVNFSPILPSVFVQRSDITVNIQVGKEPAVINGDGSKWVIVAGNLTVGPDAPDAKFTNEGQLIRERAANTPAESMFDLEYDGQQGSTINVADGTLTLRGGGMFTDPDGKIELADQTTLRLSSSDGGRKVYSVLTGKQTTSDKNATMDISDNATLSVARGAEFVSRLVGSTAATPTEKGLLLRGTGEFFVAGTLRNEGGFTWTDGRITTSGDTGGAALFSNAGVLSIEGKSLKTLTGRLLNRFSKLDSNPGEVFLRGTLTLANGAEIENEADTGLVIRGRFTIFDDGVIAVAGGSSAVFKNNGRLSVHLSEDTTTDMTATIAARFDNTGAVELSSLVVSKEGKVVPPKATQTLRITGGVAQLDGTSLTGGTWQIRPKGVLDLGGGTIKQLGKTSGFPTHVSLSGNAVLKDFKLERIENTGSLFVLIEQSLVLPGALNTSGRIWVVGNDAGLRVNGDFDQRGRLTLAPFVDVVTLKIAQIQVHNGNVTFHDGSNSSISGDFKVFTPGKFIRVRGELFGSGNINGTELAVIVAKGTVRVGNSPGVLTVDADYTQSADGTLVIEIGGTDVGINQDQLVINGNADIGGQLVFKFIDDFSPLTGQTFDFLAVSGTQSGDFDIVEIVDLAPGFEFEVAATDGGMIMIAINDGVFTGIVGEINDVTLGLDTPPNESAALAGDVDVPMLQFDVVPESAGLTITHLTMKASGTGHDVADLTAVHVWLDQDGNGQVDPRFFADPFEEDDGQIGEPEGDRQIGSGTYDADDGTLILAIDPPLELGPRERATLLITYNIAGGEADTGADAKNRTSNATHAAPKSRLPLGLGAIATPLFIAFTLALGLTVRLGFLTKRKGRATALVIACLSTAAWIAGCPGDDMIGPGPGPGASRVTFRVTLTGVGAEEADTATDASVENLALGGTTLSVDR